jgi:hypothetical protein
MTSTTDHRLAPPVEALAEEARALLGWASGNLVPAATTVVEGPLRDAHARVVAELGAIERGQRTNTPVDVARLFETNFHEKIAAILLLLHYTLRDLEHERPELLDYEFAHRDAILYAEILYRTGAAEGLALLYDFAVEREGLAPTATGKHFWHNISLHCLLFLALLPSASACVIPFILDRQTTVPPRYKELAATTQANVTAQIKELFVYCKLALAGERPLAPPEAPYVKLFRHLDPAVPYDDSIGLCSTITAESRIRCMLHAGDFHGAMRWLIYGSAGAARAVLRLAREVMPARALARMLEEVLAMEGIPLARQAAIVLELGDLNRQERPQGGDAEISRVLFETVMTDQDARLPVAQLAAHELGTVMNQPALLILAEEAPLLDAAGAAIFALRDMRRLLVAEPLLERRRELIPFYKRAHGELTEIQNLLDAVWSAPDSAMTEQHITRLIALKAWPELRKIAELAQRSDAFDPRCLMLLHQQMPTGGGR